MMKSSIAVPYGLSYFEVLLLLPVACRQEVAPPLLVIDQSPLEILMRLQAMAMQYLIAVVTVYVSCVCRAS